MFYSLGAILAPIIGGILGDHISFRPANDIMAILSGVCLLAFVFLNTSLENYKCQ